MKRFEVFFMVIQVPIDYLLLLCAAISAYYLRFANWAVYLKPVTFKLTLMNFLEISLWVALGWLIIFAIVGLYSTDPNRKLSRDITKIVLACSAGLAAVAVYVMFSQQLFDSRFLVVASWVFALVYVSFGRIVVRGVKGLLYRAGLGLRRIVVIGQEQTAKKIIAFLRERPGVGYKIVGEFISFNHGVEEEIDKIQIDELFFINPRANEKETLDAIRYCNLHHKVFKYSADLFATFSSNISVSALAGVPIAELKKTPLDGWGRVAKKVFDLVMGVLVIILTLPVFLLTSIIILIETGRPVIYKNERVGIRGKRFFTYKFRSMYQKDSTGIQFGEGGEKALIKEQKLIKEKNTRSGPIYKISSDPRVTPFGRFIRRWSIDELPQFFNVLKGEMSIVGPRPHQPREVEQYQNEYPIVFTLKPGITGLAQISGRSDLAFEEEMKLDIFYTEKWSLFLDFIVFLKTPFVIFKRRKVV